MFTSNWKKREFPHSRLKEFVATNDTVEIEKYFADIRFQSDYYTENKSDYWNSGMLYALSCVEPGYEGSKEGISQLEIITIHDFNSEYQANDTITNILEFGQVAVTVDFSDFVPHSEFVELRENNLFGQSMAFRVVEPIDNEIQLAQFKVYLKLTNGDTFESVTDSVKLKN